MAKTADRLALPAVRRDGARAGSGRCTECGEYGTFVEEIAARRPTGRSLARVGAPRRCALAEVDRVARARASPPASPSSTACSAAGSSRARSCCSAASRASASRRCCCRPPMRSRERGRQRAVRVRRGVARSRSRCARDRLGARPACIALLPEVDVAAVEAAVRRRQRPTCWSSTRSRPLYDPELAGAPGSVGQVRACTARLMRLAKDAGRHDAHRRPRHQGRRDRGPARARAHGRHRAVLRGRSRPRVPHRARGEEPVRLRRPRSASSRWGRRACRGRISPSSALLAERADGGRRVASVMADDGGLAAAARRDPGARDAELPADAASAGDRRRHRAAAAGARGARAPCRPVVLGPRRLRLRRRWHPRHRAGGRPAARARARLGAPRRRPSPRTWRRSAS